MHTLRAITIVLLSCIALLASCAKDDADGANATPDPSMVRSMEPRAAVALANEWRRGTINVTSYVDARQVVFEFSDGRSASVRLPRDEMYIAVAPYVDRTHPCSVHYTSSCQGEMAETELTVFARTTDGDVLVDGTVTTLANGFFELWLPRNTEIELVVKADGREARETITTNRNDRTCITTMQLL